jgi:hypothetical protein
MDTRSLTTLTVTLVMNTAFLQMFHAMGILTQIVQPLVTRTIVSSFELSYPNPPMLPTPRLVMDVMRKTNATAACVHPIFLEVCSSWNLFHPFLLNQSLVMGARGRFDRLPQVTRLHRRPLLFRKVSKGSERRRSITAGDL